MKSVWGALYHNRVLVLLEDAEAGVFRQVVLTEEQFRAVSDAMIRSTPPDEQHDLKPGMEVVRVALNDEVEFPADLFIGCSTVDTDT